MVLIIEITNKNNPEMVKFYIKSFGIWTKQEAEIVLNNETDYKRVNNLTSLNLLHTLLKRNKIQFFNGECITIDKFDKKPIESYNIVQ